MSMIFQCTPTLLCYAVWSPPLPASASNPPHARDLHCPLADSDPNAKLASLSSGREIKAKFVTQNGPERTDSTLPASISPMHFSSTDQPTVWLKLFRLGMGGKISDWLRMLYDHMAYYARHEDMESARFKPLWNDGTTLPPPTFHLGLMELSISTEETYVGVNLRTDTQNMFKDHYKAKARTARYCGHRITGIEDMTGRLAKLKVELRLRISFRSSFRSFRHVMGIQTPLGRLILINP
ncbi:hypothetical protein C8J57DRAFT_1246059 [Mycena rebaudengoi]|nr:hypothetical protein C8J57DRAFT_1246059 [Mycena rebaudengoi]